MCFVQSLPPLFAVSFVVALLKAHVLALSTAHVLRLGIADVLALNKAHVLRLSTKICQVFPANIKEVAFGRRPPLWFPFCSL